jgi:hypothetical protein
MEKIPHTKDINLPKLPIALSLSILSSIAIGLQGCDTNYPPAPKDGSPVRRPGGIPVFPEKPDEKPSPESRLSNYDLLASLKTAPKLD